MGLGFNLSRISAGAAVAASSALSCDIGQGSGRARWVGAGLRGLARSFADKDVSAIAGRATEERKGSSAEPPGLQVPDRNPARHEAGGNT